jgi:hypothetical protein
MGLMGHLFFVSSFLQDWFVVQYTMEWFLVGRTVVWVHDTLLVKAGTNDKSILYWNGMVEQATKILQNNNLDVVGSSRITERKFKWRNKK